MVGSAPGVPPCRLSLSHAVGSANAWVTDRMAGDDRRRVRPDGLDGAKLGVGLGSYRVAALYGQRHARPGSLLR